MNGYERILAMVEGRPVDHLPAMPITMMFAADQIGVPYGRYAADHRVMVDAQIETARRFGIDHVSGISDPAREAADCGAIVCYFDDQPPAIDESRALLAEPADLLRLKMPDPLGGGRMHDRVCGIAEFRRRVAKERAIEGWVEGPCAEAADLRGINQLMLDFYDEPRFVEDLFAFVIKLALAFARAQVDAGADIIGVGDAAASLVGPEIYRRFVWRYEKQLIDQIHALGVKVRLHICGNTTAILADIGRLGCDVVDLDYLASLAAGRTAMGKRQVLLGNIDPVRSLRNVTADQVTTSVAHCHREAGPRFIVAAGCEVPRDTPPQNLLALTEYAQTHCPEKINP